MKPDNKLEELEKKLEGINKEYEAGKMSQGEWLKQGSKVLRSIEKIINKRKGGPLPQRVPKPHSPGK